MISTSTEPDVLANPNTPAAAAPGRTASPLAIDPTEFKLGWRILLMATLGVAINANSSLLYAFGSLVLPLQKAFGWARGDLQAAVSFLFAGAIIGSQLVGWLNLRYGMRRVTCVSLVALSGVFLALTQINGNIVGLYALFTVLPIASMGTMQVTWTQLVSLGFERNRGLALAVVLSGTGLAAALIPSGVTWATARWGWQGAFVLLALLPVGLVLPFALRWMHARTPQEALAQRSSRHVESRAPGMAFGEAMRSPKFWFLNIAMSLVVAAIVAMVTCTVPLLRDKGLSAADAGRVFGAFGLSLIGGRMLVGYLIDRLWAPGVAAVALTLPALGCALMAFSGASETGALMVATFLVGFGAGAEFDIAAYLVSRYFGLRDYGRLFGVHLGLITLASTLAPWLTGALYKATGAYTVTLTCCGGAFLAGALMLLPLGRYPRFD